MGMSLQELEDRLVSTPAYVELFDKIEDVLHHYAERVKDAGTTSRLLYSTNGKAGIPLSKEEKEDITAFLKTLIDSSFLSNPLLSPFNYHLNN